MTIAATTTVGEIAVTLPYTTRIFEKYGIDYCCGGKQSIDEACSAIGVATEEVLKLIDDTATAGAATDRDYTAMSQRALIEHIVSTHHVFTRYELARLSRLIDKVVTVHGLRHPELLRVETTFRALYEELGPHMSKEEIMLFPYIGELEAAGFRGELDTPPFVTVANPVRQMLVEHETAGELLQTLRKTTSNYTAPADACISFRTLYAALEELERDLHRHIHLENNILFPKALQMERSREEPGADRRRVS